MGKIAVFILIILIMTGCYIDVMHSSNNDPGNPYGMGILNFSIRQKNSIVIDSAQVVINEEEYYTENGLIEDIALINDSLRIMVSKTGFDSIAIDTVLKTGDKIEFDIEMNSIPAIKNASVYSCTEYVYGLTDTVAHSVNVQCMVNDRDLQNDISACSVNVFDSNIPLQYAHTAGNDMIFGTVLNENLRDFNIFDLQGEPMYVSVEDKSGSNDEWGPMQLVRFIEHIPQMLRPFNGEVMIFPDTLKWSIPDIPYTVLTRIIISNEDGDTIMEQIFDSDINDHYIDSIMHSGIYNLSIILNDLYGNFSCRKLEFYIQ